MAQRHPSQRERAPPVARPRRHAERPARTPKPSIVRLPRRAWLATAFPHHGAHYSVQFEALLHEPSTTAFLAANPAVASN